MLASVGICNELYEGVSFAWNIPRLLEISAFPVLVVEGYMQCVALPDNSILKPKICLQGEALDKKRYNSSIFSVFYDFLAKLRFSAYF